MNPKLKLGLGFVVIALGCSAPAWAKICTDDFVSVFRRLGLMSKPVPSELDLQSLPLRTLNAGDLRSARNGKPVAYFVDQDDRLWVLPDGEPLSTHRVSFISDASKADSEPHFVKESGHLFYNSKSRNYTLTPHHSVGLTEEEDARVRTSFLSHLPEGSVPENRLVHPIERGVSKSKVLSCLDAVNDQTNGTHFVRDQLIGGNLVTGAVIAYEEIRGAGRLQTPQGAGVILSDVIGNNVANVAYGILGKQLVLLGTGPVANFAARTLLGTTLTASQNFVYKGVLHDNQADDRADKITKFDYEFMLGRVPATLVIDHVLMNSVPPTFFAACARDSAAKLIISPTTLRIVEKAGFSLIYYQLRKSAIDE